MLDCKCGFFSSTRSTSESGNDDDNDDAEDLISESINKMQIYLSLLFLLASGLGMTVNLICLFHSSFQIWFRK